MRDEQLKTSLKGIDDLKTVPDEHTVAAITDLPGNITKCKRGESINKARDFYLTLLDKFPALIWRSDVNAKCDYFNQTWLEFTGRSMEQEMGDGWAEGVHLEDLAGCLQSFLKAFHSRQPFTLEYRLRRHDEEYRWIIDQGRAFNDLDGQFAGYIGSCVDITERKQAEEARTRLAEMVESSDDAIIGKTLDGIITSWNRGAEKMFGYSAQQSIGKPILMLIPPERANEEREILARIARGESVDHFETVRVRKDGKRIDISVTVSPLKDGRGKVTGASKIARDITERKQAETSLKLVRTLIDQSSDGFEVIDPETGRFLDVNGTTCKRLGYKREELLSMSVPDVETVAVDFSSWHKVVEEIHQSDLKIIEGRHRRKDGSTFPVEVSVRYVKLERDYLVASVRDITEREKTEQQLSNREYQVMHLTTSGKSLKEIASELSISIQTVSTHRARVLKKMGLHNSAELIRYAAENDLIG